MTSKFNTGDVVILNSGGPDMTILTKFNERIGPSDNIEVTWITKEGDKKTAVFPPECLKLKREIPLDGQAQIIDTTSTIIHEESIQSFSTRSNGGFQLPLLESYLETYPDVYLLQVGLEAAKYLPSPQYKHPGKTPKSYRTVKIVENPTIKQNDIRLIEISDDGVFVLKAIIRLVDEVTVPTTSISKEEKKQTNNGIVNEFLAFDAVNDLEVIVSGPGDKVVSIREKETIHKLINYFKFHTKNLPGGGFSLKYVSPLKDPGFSSKEKPVSKTKSRVPESEA
jgi:uncharacterized protein YodC (DUF2158 family)